MKVLVFIDSLDKQCGGPSRSVPILSKGLAQVGVHVTLMTVESDDMNVHSVEGTDVRLVVLHKNTSYGELKAKILYEHYDIIHNQMIWNPIYHTIARIARKYGIPYLTTPRGTLEPWAYSGQGLVKSFKKKLAMLLYQKKDLECASCILTTADMERMHLRQLGIQAPITVIPNGIEFESFPCRSAYDFNIVKNQVLFLSRIHPKKGIEILINAWENIHNDYPDWNIVIVGNGDIDYIESLKRLVIDKGLSSSIKILPPVYDNEKIRLYRESSVFCLPTYSENFGMVIAEALSCGLPVITTKGTPWEMLETSQSGWWINLSQTNLENTMRTAISCRKDKLFEMGQRGSQMVKENFDYIEVANKLKSVYDWILGLSNRPDSVTTIH